MKKIIALVAIGLVFIALPQIRGRAITVKLVSGQEARKLISEKKVFLLDVHTPEQTHIPGTDAFIPYDQIEKNLDKLPSDKNTPILVYCRTGNMSKIASDQLAKLGYQVVYDLEGGTNAFKEINAEVVLFPGQKNLGQVVYGEVAETSFTLTNYTPAPLKITRISTSCGCTKAKVNQTELKPYESTLVSVTFDPAVHKDDTDIGELTRTIFIETDNPNFPKVTSEIKALVIKK